MKTLTDRLANAEPAPPWGIDAVIFAIAAAFFAIFAGTLVGVALFGSSADGGAVTLALHVGWIIGAVFAVVFVLQTRRKPEERAALRLSAQGVALPFVAFVAFGLAVGLDVVGLAVTGAFVPVVQLATFSPITAAVPDWIAAIVLMLIALPAADELVFRGLVFPVLRVGMGGWLGWLISAVLYGLFSWVVYTPGYAEGDLVRFWYGLILPMLSGLVFGAVRAATGSTRAAMAAHAAFGLFAILKLLVIVQ